MDIVLQPIGVIRSPFKKLEDMPIQPAASHAAEGALELLPRYQGGLQDLDGFSHIYVIYHFHKTAAWKERVIPFLDDQERGIFATRAPARPNPIGLSVMEILEIRGCRIRVRNVDALDGTPLLDIKPYVPQFDHAAGARIGWLSESISRLENATSDGRFNDS
jgi:tRNA-Thr(GGU) m(6)t(6)A37 methyltransferase TsaA